ncbi:hypothetical protein C8J56DRAFT_898342 [Mycena floridula]|nr:hypothetical protein C8J56DRAFT_898342 [Mycena floridula]
MDDNDNFESSLEKGSGSMIADLDFTEAESIPEQGTEGRRIAEWLLIRKLDSRRNGISSARLKGLEEDLGLTDVQYSVVLSVLFLSYCLAQVPSNMILNYISRKCSSSPSRYIGGCVVAWGIASALTGITKKFSHIVASRFFIGFPEVRLHCDIPSSSIAYRYRKPPSIPEPSISFQDGIQKSRLSPFKMVYKKADRGWNSFKYGRKGLFYIKPHNTTWITVKERYLAQARLEDIGEADQDDPEDSLKLAVLDLKVRIFAVMSTTQILGLSVAQFFPSLTQTLGYNTTISLVLAAPPWILAAIFCCIGAWHADRTRERFFHISGWIWLSIPGFIIALCTMSTPARYVSMILMACGSSGFAIALVWVSNAIPRPPAKRAAAIGIVNGLGNLAASLKDVNNTRIKDSEAARLEGITFQQALKQRKGFCYLY